MKRRRRLIGRERDLDRLIELLGSHHLVTIWGAAGIGKTSLAQELLEKRRGVFYDLAEARTEDDVASVLLRVPRNPGVVVLDNFEQVVGCAPSLGAWLDGMDQIVVTSRERLRVEGEACLELGPLGIEDALALFVDHVRRLGSEPASLETARALVARLECIPLALELAAARHDVLGVEGLDARLEAPIPLLSRGRRDAPERHATLEAAIAWSWEALSEEERRSLMGCSAFRGGFTVEAAEAVLGDRDAYDLLQSLRDKSLVRSEAHGGSRRFSMFESIRDFAERRLRASGEAKAVWTRHAAHFAAAAVDVGDERANLLIAAERSLEGTEELTPEAIHALAAVEPIIGARGPYQRYLELLERALLLRSSEPKLLRARARILQRMGRIDRAEQDLSSALSVARSSGDALEEGTLIVDLGVLRQQERRLTEAESLYREALAIHRTHGHRRAEGRALGNLGAVEHDRRDYRRAEEAYQAALAIDREVGDLRHEGLFLGNLGLLEHERGDLERAALRYHEALLILERVSDHRQLAITIGNRGVLHHERGELEQAVACHQRALELLAEIDDQRSLGLGMIRLACVEAMLGRAAAPRLLAAESLLSRPRDELGIGIAELAGAFLEVALAQRAWLADRIAESGARVREAESRIERARTLLNRSDDARLFTRMLGKLIAGFGDGGPNALVVGGAVRFVRPPHGSWIDLSRRVPLRLMMQHLTEAALQGGRWSSMETLRAAAWPGETIRAAAAANRVYVAITTLRKLGLADVLVSGESGYRLGPHLEIVLSPGPEEPARA